MRLLMFSGGGIMSDLTCYGMGTDCPADRVISLLSVNEYHHLGGE